MKRIIYIYIKNVINNKIIKKIIKKGKRVQIPLQTSYGTIHYKWMETKSSDWKVKKEKKNKPHRISIPPPFLERKGFRTGPLI